MQFARRGAAMTRIVRGVFRSTETRRYEIAHDLLCSTATEAAPSQASIVLPVLLPSLRRHRGPYCNEVVMVVMLVVQTLLLYGTMGLVLFLAAGTTDWPVAGIFLAEMIIVFLGGGLWLPRDQPAPLKERLAPPIQKDQPIADKILLTVFILVIFGTLVLVALDAVRFGASFVPP